MLGRWLTASCLIAGGMACVSPESTHREHVHSIQMWKEQCGLLWIIDTDPMINLDIQITGKDGHTNSYGNGTILDSKHLVSSFCRNQWTAVNTFRIVLTSRDGIKISGNVEAWYNGKRLDVFTFDGTAFYQASISIPKENP